MGMFDNINVEIDCPACGVTVGNFQSKDRDCRLDTLDPVEVENFYTSCYCGQWIEFERPYAEKPHRKTPFSRDEVESLGFKLK